MTSAVLSGLLAATAFFSAASALAQTPTPAPTPAQRATQMAEVFDGKALRVILCGTSAPLPDPARAKSCTLVVAGDEAFVIDTGPESWETLAQMAVPGAKIRGVFLTHFHSDHIGDLGEFRMQTMVAGRTFRLPVYGPRGVKKVVQGFNTAYALDAEHRLAHHGAAIIDIKASPLVAHEFGKKFGPGSASEEVILQRGQLKITAFQVDHDPVRPAVGYRFDYGGRSVVVSGDTAKANNLVENATGADVLVSESLAANLVSIGQQQAASGGNARIAKLLGDVIDYHATPVEAAEMANAAGVKLLVYSHFMPSAQAASPLYMAGVAAVRPADQWVSGYDMLRVDLPLGSAEVRQIDMRRAP